MYSLIAALGNSVSSAAAADAGAQAGSPFSSIIMIVLMVAVFYFLLIRPQKKRDKEAKEMMASLKKGDKVITIGGIRGTVAAVTEQSVFVKVDDNVKIEFSKSAISSVLGQKKETEKTEEKEAPKKKEKKEKKEEKVEVVEAPKTDSEK